jgi:catechol 2,3-dioxygenase-like lactoylglutathione lyase family enzyme
MQMQMQLDHVNLSVTNLAASVDWYRRVFGFEAVERGTYGDVPWAIIKSGSALLALYEHPDRTVPDTAALDRVKHHGIAHVGLRISDERAWLDTVKRERVQVDHEWRYPHSRSWYVVDPSGWEIEVALWDQGEVKFG